MKWTIPEKKQTGGVEDMEFPGVLKKENMEIPGVNEKRSRISKGVQGKTQMEFRWVLVFDIGISKGCHTILVNFQGWKLVFSGIFKGEITNLKFLEEGFQKSIFSTPPVWFFSGITQYIVRRACIFHFILIGIPSCWTIVC